MTISAFTDGDHPPTIEEVCNLLGSRQSLWLDLNRFMVEYYGLPGEWKFAGKNYGWEIGFRKSGRTIVTLYPQNEALVAQLVLGQAQVPAALGLKLGVKIRRLIVETPQLHDGRWLYIRVRSARDLRDVEQLILVKSPLSKRRRSPA